MTPLLVACFEGHVDAMTLLLDRGASVDLPEVNETTALYIACEEG